MKLCIIYLYDGVDELKSKSQINKVNYLNTKIINCLERAPRETVKKLTNEFINGEVRFISDQSASTISGKVHALVRFSANLFRSRQTNTLSFDRIEVTRGDQQRRDGAEARYKREQVS